MEPDQPPTGIYYSITNVFKQTPSQIKDALTSVIALLAAAGLLPFSDRTALAVVGCLTIVLGLLYVGPRISSNAKLEALKKDQDERDLNALALGQATAAPVIQEVHIHREPVKKN